MAGQAEGSRGGEMEEIRSQCFSLSLFDISTFDIFVLSHWLTTIRERSKHVPEILYNKIVTVSKADL